MRGTHKKNWQPSKHRGTPSNYLYLFQKEKPKIKSNIAVLVIANNFIAEIQFRVRRLATKDKINKGGLRVSRDALGVANFFVVRLCAQNSIPALKLLTISKTNELDYFTIFRGLSVV